MTEKEFDELLRSKVGGCAQEAGEDLWNRLDAGLVRRKRARVIRRSFAVAAAAAACLVVGLVLSDGNEAVTIQQNAIAEASAAMDIKPVREQIRAIEEQLAQNSVQPAATQETAEAQRPAEVQEPASDEKPSTTAEPAKSSESAKIDEPAKTEKPARTEETATAAAASIDWNALAREDEREYPRRSTLLALASNLTSNAAGDGFMADLGPAHASSQSGLHPSAGLPVPVDQPEYFMPLSFGAQIKIPVGRHLYAGIGASYSYIVSRYASMVNGVLYPETYSQLHYVGIPVNLQYNFIENRNFDAYASIGAMADKCLNARYVYGQNVQNTSVEGLQYSAMAGIGVEYWMTRHLGIYLDPSIVWYFNNTAHPQPLSIRTAEPLQASFEAGLRFRFK